MEKGIALKNLNDLQKIFPKAFLVYGSCLGAIREGDIIDWDLDTDMGILAKDFDKKKVEEAKKIGFRVIHTKGTLTDGYEVAFGRDGVKTDLFLFYDGGKYYWNALWDRKKKIIHLYPKELIQPQKIQIGKYVFNCLGENYVRYVYGPNWKIPKKDFDWRTDHQCKRLEKIL